MYRVKFYALADDSRHEMYVPERMVADIICKPEYHLIDAKFLYSYQKPDPQIPSLETIQQLENIICDKHEPSKVKQSETM
jgi:hypothetical protein